MRRNEIENGIARSWALVDRLGMGHTFSNGGSLGIDEGVRNLLLQDDIGYVELYLEILTRSHYNFMLFDYSCLQYSYLKEGHYRYAFFPNPFAAQSDAERAKFQHRVELLESGTIEHEEFLNMIRDEPVRMNVPPIRYDSAPEQYIAHSHPASHLHIGHLAQGRWGLDRVISPLAFTMMLLKFFYAKEWANLATDEADLGNPLEGELVSEKANCRIIGEALFSATERRTFYIG
jgi:hypothetical protein